MKKDRSILICPYCKGRNIYPLYMGPDKKKTEYYFCYECKLNIIPIKVERSKIVKKLFLND